MAKLIPCGSCGNEIALTARTCPKCGAVNQYVHPEVKRFLESKDKVAFVGHFLSESSKVTFYVNDQPLWKPHYHIKIYAALSVVSLVVMVIHFRHLSAMLGLGAVGFTLGAIIDMLKYPVGFYLICATAIGIPFSIVTAGTPCGRTLVIDFSEDPPKISCDDHELFAEVLAFFSIENKKAA